jgi:hypothetical protein
MSDDLWDDPSAKAWTRHVIDEMVPKLAGSACTISLVPEDREGDVKFWVELGASIMLDKPLIAIVLGDTPVPRKLALVADGIVRAPDGINPAASEALRAALRRILPDG